MGDSLKHQVVSVVIIPDGSFVFPFKQRYEDNIDKGVLPSDNFVPEDEPPLREPPLMGAVDSGASIHASQESKPSVPVASDAHSGMDMVNPSPSTESSSGPHFVNPISPEVQGGDVPPPPFDIPDFAFTPKSVQNRGDSQENASTNWFHPWFLSIELEIL